jgi:hypothetical protein
MSARSDYRPDDYSVRGPQQISTAPVLPEHWPRGACTERVVVGALHRREREAHPQPRKELEDGGTRSIDQYLLRDAPTA